MFTRPPSLATHRRRAVLKKLHAQLAGRKRCLSMPQLAAFVNEHIPEWSAHISSTSHTPRRKAQGARYYHWEGKQRDGYKLSIWTRDRLPDASTPTATRRVLEHDTTDSHHRNSFTLREILSAMGCGQRRSRHPDAELKRYDWYNPFGMSK